jgi:hypothetical protein
MTPAIIRALRRELLSNDETSLQGEAVHQVGVSGYDGTISM